MPQSATVLADGREHGLVGVSPRSLLGDEVPHGIEEAQEE